MEGNNKEKNSLEKNKIDECVKENDENKDIADKNLDTNHNEDNMETENNDENVDKNLDSSLNQELDKTNNNDENVDKTNNNENIKEKLNSNHNLDSSLNQELNKTNNNNENADKNLDSSHNQELDKANNNNENVKEKLSSNHNEDTKETKNNNENVDKNLDSSLNQYINETKNILDKNDKNNEKINKNVDRNHNQDLDKTNNNDENVKEKLNSNKSQNNILLSKKLKDVDFYLINLDDESYDTIEFRKGYKDLKDNKKFNDNLHFQIGKIKSQPDGDLIENIHKNWFGDYKKLEIHHGYIQWLFPLQTEGVNYNAQALQKHEIKELKENHKELLEKNLLMSLELMLDFYGMKFVDRNSGKLGRTDKYKERYKNLMRNTHNFLRITRILKCLAEFDMESYQISFLEFLIEEVFVTQELNSLASSLTRFWVHTIKNDEKRKLMKEKIKNIINNI